MKISKEKLVAVAELTGFRAEMLEKVIHLLSLLEGFRSHPFLLDLTRSRTFRSLITEKRFSWPSSLSMSFIFVQGHIYYLPVPHSASSADLFL
jgi:formate-dependent nitrite reductase membrane component NrfD